ncbi:MAG: hypothetical protein ACMUJM_13645 [bacterium]
MYVLVIRPITRIDGQLDPIEKSVDGGCVPLSGDSARSLQGTGMDSLDPNFVKTFQQFLTSQSLQNALIRLGDYRLGIAGEPDGGNTYKVLGARTSICILPLQILTCNKIA